MEWTKYLSLVFVSLFIVGTVLAADVTSESEQVNATLILTNSPPTIDSVTPGSTTYDPVEAGTTLVTIYFVASDSNGVSDIDDSTAQAVITNGATTYTNTSCVGTDLDADSVNYTCTFTLHYYDNYGDWSINVSVRDNSNALAYNDSETFYYSKLAALELINTPIDFGSLTLGTNDNPNQNNPLKINNTGNLALNINITGADLVGVTNPAYKIGVGNVTVDDDATLNEGTETGNNELTLSTSAQTYNPNGSPVAKQSTADLYFWIDLPSTGLIAQQYNATWTITGFE